MIYETITGQVSLFDQDGWSGKTSPELSQAELPKGKTSGSSLKRRQGSKTQMPLFLNLISGQTQDSYWEKGGALLGVYSMHSFGEQPTSMMKECQLNLEHRSGVGESLLSQILTDTVQEKYYLSPKACMGILNRSEKRGKELPELLKIALENQASLSKSGGGCEVDSLGKKAGKGALIQTELSGTLGVTQDQTLFEAVTHTHTHTHGDSVTGERLQGCDIRSGHQGRSDQDSSRAYSQMRYEAYQRDEKSPTIKWHGGSYGGGSEVLVNDVFSGEPSTRLKSEDKRRW